MKVEFKNPKTNEIKEVKVGWSWILFLFSSIFGLPLFLRKLYVWGGLFLVFWVVNLLGSLGLPEEQGLGLNIIMSLISLCLSIFLGVKGNEMTAKNYLETGWEIAEPDSANVRIAKAKWGISV